MRIKLTLNNRPNSLLSLNYNYEISAAVYKILERADPAFASWLHEVGYTLQARHFKLFTISNLHFGPGFRIHRKEGMVSLGERQELILSFLVNEAVEKFIYGVFKEQRFGIGTLGLPPVDFYIQGVEILPPPIFAETMRFRTLSPIIISRYEAGKKYEQYMSPEEPGYGEQLFMNLNNKYQSAQEHGLVPALPGAGEQVFLLLNKPKKRGILIKAGTPEQTKVIGYEFEFELHAQPELMRFGYEAGMGWDNPVFGAVEAAPSTILQR